MPLGRAPSARSTSRRLSGASVVSSIGSASRYRAGRPRLDLEGRCVVIVDDGIATGATARAACHVARAHGASRIVLAVPVAPPATVSALQDVCDDMLCVANPDPFFAVGEWYHDFSPTSDEEVNELFEPRSAVGEGLRIGRAACGGYHYLSRGRVRRRHGDRAGVLSRATGRRHLPVEGRHDLTRRAQEVGARNHHVLAGRAAGGTQRGDHGRAGRSDRHGRRRRCCRGGGGWRGRPRRTAPRARRQRVGRHSGCPSRWGGRRGRRSRAAAQRDDQRDGGRDDEDGDHRDGADQPAIGASWWSRLPGGDRWSPLLRWRRNLDPPRRGLGPGERGRGQRKGARRFTGATDGTLHRPQGAPTRGSRWGLGRTLV